ncbi:hypothetical protein [Enterococcus phage vB_Efs22_KEN09]
MYKLHPQRKGNMIYYRSSRDTNKKKTDRKEDLNVITN